MKKMTIIEFQQYVISEAKKLMRAEVLNEEKRRIIGQLKVLNEGEDIWDTSIMNVAEVDNFIDYLDGWNLQYDAPIDLGNGKVSIRHQKETEDVMNQMNHQNSEERLSNMDDISNYSMDEIGEGHEEGPVFDSAKNARATAEHNAWQFAGKIFQDLDDETRFSKEALVNIADGMKVGISNYLQTLINSYPEGQLKEGK